MDTPDGNSNGVLQPYLNYKTGRYSSPPAGVRGTVRKVRINEHNQEEHIQVVWHLFGIMKITTFELQQHHHDEIQVYNDSGDEYDGDGRQSRQRHYSDTSDSSISGYSNHDQERSYGHGDYHTEQADYAETDDDNDDYIDARKV